jgi:hypothetical protein
VPAANPNPRSQPIPAHMIPNSFLRHLFKAAILLALATPSRAEPVLSFVFDDPNGQAANVRDAQVASGTGGEARLRLEEADWSDPAAAEKVFQIVVDTTMGTKAFLRLINDKENPGSRGVVIAPAGAEVSLAAISRNAEGKVAFNGGIDMFFRYSEELPSQQELLPNLLSIGGGSLRLVVEADSGSMIATLVDDKQGTIIDTDGDGTADATRVSTSPVKPAPIDPEAPYHLAIAFETGDSGVVTAKVFLKPGTGPIDTKQDEDLVSQATFSVITEDSETSLHNGSFSIGTISRTDPAKAILDLAAFRIFVPAPAIFPDISGKE